MVKKLFQRKKYIVSPKFQFGFFRLYLLLFVGSYILIFFAVNSYFMELQELGNLKGYSANDPYFLLLTKQSNYFYYTMIELFFFALAVSLLFAILVSHKAAGPIVKLINHMNRADKGNLKEIHFRKDDFFIELSESYNNFIKKIK